MTHFPTRSPAGMLGPSTAFNWVGRFLRHSPQPLLGGCGSAFRRATANPAERSRRFGTTFLSPAATVRVSRPPRRGQRSRPIPSTSCRIIHEPVRPLNSLSRSPVGSGSGTIHRSQPVVRRLTQQPRFLLKPPLPVGGFRPLRIVALSPVQNRGAYSSGLPDFLSLPASALF